MEKSKYSVDQLRHLAKIRANTKDDYYDDRYTSDKDIFESGTEQFFDWLERMEEKGKISELLNHKIK